METKNSSLENISKAEPGIGGITTLSLVESKKSQLHRLKVR
jgi:hypothetical protein